MNPTLEYELAELLAGQPCVTEEEARRQLGIPLPKDGQSDSLDTDCPPEKRRRREPVAV